MPPLNLLTKDFLRSLLVVESSKKSAKPSVPDTEEELIQEVIFSDEDTEETDASSTNQKINIRRKKMKFVENNLQNGNVKKNPENFDEKLNNLAVDLTLVKLFEL